MCVVRLLLVLAISAGVAACGSKFKTYDGPEVTRIEVHKTARRMYLFHNDEVLESYRVGLGWAPNGHKAFEGDGRTPEGAYTIDRRNPSSNFHLSIGISYPNDRDIEVARAAGVPPGGDIFIHGRAGKHRARGRGRDWTDGCIAVTDREMEDVYAMVRDGTPIVIHP